MQGGGTAAQLAKGDTSARCCAGGGGGGASPLLSSSPGLPLLPTKGAADALRTCICTSAGPLAASEA